MTQGGRHLRNESITKCHGNLLAFHDAMTTSSEHLGKLNGDKWSRAVGMKPSEDPPQIDAHHFVCNCHHADAHFVLVDAWIDKISQDICAIT